MRMRRVALDESCVALRHGTGWAYSRWGCRCPDARAARRSQWHVNYGRSGRRRGVFARHRDVDPVVIRRAAAGEVVADAGTAERELVVTLLTETGLSSAQIAARLRLAPRSVCRIRSRLRARAEEEKRRCAETPAETRFDRTAARAA